MRNFHRNHLYAVLSRQVEHKRQTILAMPLKSIGAGARLVGAHTRANLAIIAQRF